MPDFTEIASGGGLVALAVVALIAFLGLRSLVKPERGPHPGRAEVDPDPPRPNTSAVDREAAVADHEAQEVEWAVERAMGGETLADNPPHDLADPHGLADALNRRRR